MRTSSTGITASTCTATARRRSSPPSSATTTTAIPAYEQIYALAGPDPDLPHHRRPAHPQRCRDDDRPVRPVLPRPRAGRLLLAPRPASRSTRAPSRSAHNRARKNWNSVGDHAPAYLINLYLATGEERYADCSRSPSTRSPSTSRTTRTARSCRRSSSRTGRHDTAHVAAEPRRGRAQPQDRLEPDAHEQPASRRTKYEALARKIAEVMPAVGSDQQRGGWYDVMERGSRPGEDMHRFAFHDRKAWWQQEQGILAYLILHGVLGDDGISAPGARVVGLLQRLLPRPRRRRASTSTCWRTACRT